MNESSTDVLVLNEQAIPDRPLEEVMPLEEFIPPANDEQSIEAISAGLRELATRFLDIQSPNSNGLTIDYVKSIRFEDLMMRLRKQEVISVTREMFESIQEVIRSLRHTDLATLDASERQYLNIRVILAGYMTGFHPNQVFESMGVVENQLLESSARFLTELESIVNYLKTNETINVDVINDFYRLLKIYLRDFKAWKEPDMIVMTSRIIHALKALYGCLARLPSPDQDEVEDEVEDAVNSVENPTRVEMENSVAVLRAKLVHLQKQDLLDELDEWRETALEGQINGFNATVIPPQFNSSEELLRLASRLARESVGFASKMETAANEQVVHELLIDPSFQIGDDGSIGGRIFSVNQAFIDVFWSGIIDDLKQPEAIYTSVLQVFKDILNGINDIVGSTSAVGEEAKALINVDHMQASMPLDDWNTCMDLFESVYKLICRIQMQKREDDAKEKWDILQTTLLSVSELPDDQPDAICAALKFLFDRVKIMLIDYSNSRLTLISQVIRDNGVKYEQDKFQERLNNGTLTLKKTTDWLYKEVDNITIKQLRQLLNGNMDVFRSIHRSALVNLIVKPTIDLSNIDVIPEVLHMDHHRIGYFSEQYQKLVNCATVMRIISDFAFQAQNLQTDDGQDETETKSAVLTSISNIVLECNPKNVKDIGHLIEVIIDRTPLWGLVCDERMEAMCKEMEVAISDPYHATRTTVSKRIIDYWKQFNVQQADTEPLHSVYAIATAITNDARSLSALAALNVKIHLPVYTSIIAGVVGYITIFTTEVMVPAGVPDAYNPAASSGDSGTGVSRCADDPGYSEAAFLAVA